MITFFGKPFPITSVYTLDYLLLLDSLVTLDTSPYDSCHRWHFVSV